MSSFFFSSDKNWVSEKTTEKLVYIYVLLDLSKFRDPSQLINIPQIFIHLTQAISLRNLGWGKGAVIISRLWPGGGVGEEEKEDFFKRTGVGWGQS